jgi:hypothetical protein
MEDIFAGLTEKEIEIVTAIASKGAKTFEEVAQEVGVSTKTIFNYRQKPHIKKAVRELVLSNTGDHLPEVMDILMKQVRKGNMRSIELYTKLLGLQVEQQNIRQTTTIETKSPYDNMSDEELEAELKRLEQQTQNFNVED